LLENFPSFVRKGHYFLVHLTSSGLAIVSCIFLGNSLKFPELIETALIGFQAYKNIENWSVLFFMFLYIFCIEIGKKS
jgi:hypothetical protein